MKCARGNPEIGDIGYNQYTVPDNVAVEPTFVALFPLALANIRQWPLVPFFQISFKNSELKTSRRYIKKNT